MAKGHNWGEGEYNSVDHAPGFNRIGTLCNPRSFSANVALSAEGKFLRKSVTCKRCIAKLERMGK